MQELLQDDEYKDAAFTFDYDGDFTTSRKTANDVQEDEDDDVSSILPPPKKKSKRKITTDDVAITVEESTPPVSGKMIIRAHKAILTARSPYFKALFRKQTFQPTTIIRVHPPIQPHHVRIMLEFLYTNRIANIEHISTEDLLRIMHLADLWLFEALKKYVEYEFIKPSSPHMTIDTVGRLYAATQECGGGGASSYNNNSNDRFQNACVEFILENIREMADHPELHAVLKQHPTLYMPVLKRAAEIIEKKGLVVMATNSSTTTTAAVAATQAHHHHHHHHNPTTTTTTATTTKTTTSSLHPALSLATAAAAASTATTTTTKKESNPAAAIAATAKPTTIATHRNIFLQSQGGAANSHRHNNNNNNNNHPPPPPGPANHNNNNHHPMGSSSSSPHVPDIL
jgi:hypothetical protein